MPSGRPVSARSRLLALVERGAGLASILACNCCFNPENALDRLVETRAHGCVVEGRSRGYWPARRMALPQAGPPAATLALSGVASQLQMLKIVEMRLRVAEALSRRTQCL